jgi:glycopeptide antibiotics resistance protein
LPDPRPLIGLPFALLVAVLAGRRVAAATGSGRFTGSLLAFSVTAILVITLLPMPPSDGLREGPRCLIPSLSAFRSGELLRVDDVSLNVVLFVPLGIAVAWLPRQSLPGVLALAIALPWAVETIQLLVPALGRACQSVDITTNLLGLAVGLGVGAVARWIATR